jgi:hypothetical protein
LDDTENLDSIALLNMEGTSQEDIAEVKAHTSGTDASYVMMHGNGVISAFYYSIHMPAVAVVNSWYPDGMKGFGGHPYPRQKEDVSVVMRIPMEVVGTLYSKSASIIPDLVLLCTEVHGQ